MINANRHLARIVATFLAALGISCAGFDPSTALAAYIYTGNGTDSVAAQPVGSNRLVSVRESGHRTKEPSTSWALSADGHHILFVSSDEHLLEGERVEGAQLYTRDLRTGDNELISRAIDGGGANGAVLWPADISADGSRVVFASTATNLAPNDPNDRTDIYLYDVPTGAIVLVSHGPGSGPGNGPSSAPAISDDGLHVAYESTATDLDPAGRYWFQPTPNIFRYDGPRDASKLITEAYFEGGASDGASHNPDISADGAIIVFDSLSTQLVPDAPFESHIYRYDARIGDMTVVSANSHSYSPKISTDGQYVVYYSEYAANPDDPIVPQTDNLYLVHLSTLVTTLITRGCDGGPASYPNEHPGTTQASISSDGSRVAFVSPSTNLVPGDTNSASDVFLYDAAGVTVTLLTHAREDGPADGDSGGAFSSADGREVSYHSVATDLVRRDKNAGSDVFLYRAP